MCLCLYCTSGGVCMCEYYIFHINYCPHMIYVRNPRSPPLTGATQRTLRFTAGRTCGLLMRRHYTSPRVIYHLPSSISPPPHLLLGCSCCCAGEESKADAGSVQTIIWDSGATSGQLAFANSFFAMPRLHAASIRTTRTSSK